MHRKVRFCYMLIYGAIIVGFAELTYARRQVYSATRRHVHVSCVYVES